jgi:hypothetical protein
MRQILSLLTLIALTGGVAYANCGEEDCAKGKCDKSKAECVKKAHGKACKKSRACAKAKEVAAEKVGEGTEKPAEPQQ